MALFRRRRSGYAAAVFALVLGGVPFAPRIAAGLDDPALSVIDTSGDVGQFSSVAIGSDGLPVFAFYDATNGDLRVAHCEDPQCAASSVVVVDSGGNVGQYSSIAVGSDGLGLISYYDRTKRDLKVAHCNNADCSSASVSTIDAAGDVGQYSSVAIGTDGKGVVSYYGPSGGDLKVAHCNDATCSSASTAIVDATGDVGKYSDVAIGPDGFGLISYYDATNADVKVAHCNNTACSSATKTVVDGAGSVGEYSSVGFGADGLGLVSYYDRVNRDLKIAHCADAGCTMVAVAAIDTSGDVGQHTSVAVGLNGLGAISYYDRSNRNLKVAQCGNAGCSSATPFIVDSPGDVGQYSSLAISSSGHGLFSYYDAANRDLKSAHCGVACGFTTGGQPPSLLLSTAANRSNPVSLEEATVDGEVFIFVQADDPQVVDVSFWVDDPGMAGPAFHVDTSLPWDLVGGDATAALPFDTTNLSNGSHQITVVVDNGTQTTILSADFNVDNISPPSETELLFSFAEDRSDSIQLDGAVVWGDIAMFASSMSDNVDQVTFYLDDPTMNGSPYSTDVDSPYDFNGSVAAHPASPAVFFDTTSISDGAHTITVVVDFMDPVGDSVVTAGFEVDNDRIIVLDAPGPGAVIFGTESFAASPIPGAPPITSVDFLVNGMLVTSDNSSPYLVDIDTTTILDGDGVLVARANIAGGGFENSLPVQVRIDNALTADARVSEDYQRGLIGPDDHALWGMYSLTNIGLLPARYQAAMGENEGTSSALQFLSEWDSLDQATRDEIEEYNTVTEVLIDPGQGPQSLGVEDFPSCDEVSGNFVRLYFIVGKYFNCKLVVGRYQIYFTLDSINQENGVPDLDFDDNDIPDYIDDVVASLDAAWDVYETALGFDMPDVFPINVVIHQARGSVLPPWWTLGRVTMQLDDDNGQFYLPRHELFHAVQYEYMPFFHTPQPEEIWWMEATAEWGAHQASGFPGDLQPDRYSVSLPAFMSTSTDHIASTSGGRQYGAFILAEYMEERSGTAAIKETWSDILTGTPPVEAISVVLGGLDSELPGFARSNYLLGSWDNVEPYVDTDTGDWRNVLGTAGGAVAADSQGGARPARETYNLVPGESYSSWENVGYGGASYNDLVPPTGQDGFLVIDVEAADVNGYQLLAFDTYPSLCQAPIPITEATGGHVEIFLGNGCTFATLVSTSGAFNGIPSFPAWEAAFIPGAYPAIIGGLNFTGGTSHVVDYYPRNQGSLLIAYITFEITTGGGSIAWTPPGWTLLGQPLLANTNSAVYYKTAESTSGDTVDFATPFSTRMAANVIEVDSWDGQTAPAISAPNYVSGYGTRFPDPGSVTIPWGSGASLFLPTAGVGSNFVWAIPPPGYDMLFFVDANVGVSHGMAVRYGFGKTEDPEPFTIGNEPWPWVAYTVAVRIGDSP